MMFSKIVEQYQSIHIVDQCNFKMHRNLLRTLFKYTENSTKRIRVLPTLIDEININICSAMQAA